MLNSIFSGLFGSQVNPQTAPPAAIGAAQQHGLMNQQGMSMQQLQHHAAQQFNAAYSQALASGQGGLYQRHQWMINGVGMSFDQFVDTLCPESDDPMRTFLILKYKGTK